MRESRTPQNYSPHSCVSSIIILLAYLHISLLKIYLQLMTFVYPAFLWALAAIAIPIAIHLFNFRRYKTVFFSSLRYLKEVQTETKRSRKLKHYLVLASRILAITALVMAFARPVIPTAGSKVKQGDKAVSVYIDNSYSMQAVGPDGTLLDKAKQTAEELVKQYKPSDKFQLLTNDFEGKHQRLLSRDEFLELLKEVDYSPAFRKLSEVFSRQRDFLNAEPQPNKQAFIISDFQQSGFDPEAVKNDTTIVANLIPLKANSANNLYVDSVWFATPYRKLNQPEELTVRVVNTGTTAADNVPLKLFINKVQKAPTSVSVKAGEAVEVKLSYTIQQPGLQYAELQLTDHPITYDDKFFFSYAIANNLNVLAINGGAESAYLNSLFANDVYTKLTNMPEGQIDYAAFNAHPLIILNGVKSISSGLSAELKKFTDAGGSLFIFPPTAGGDMESYKQFLTLEKTAYFEALDTAKQRVTSLSLEDEVYKDIFEKQPANIDLPVVFKHYAFSRGLAAEEVLMKFANGQSFLSRFTAGKGRVYLCASPLDPVYSNFPKHALFVPTMYKIALYSGTTSALYFMAGNDNSIDAGNVTIASDNVFKIKELAGKTEFIPAHRSTGYGTVIDLGNQAKEAGNYMLMAGTDTIMPIALNYNRNESDLKTVAETDILSSVEKQSLSNFAVLDVMKKGISKSLAEVAEGKQLWRWFIFAALFFLLAEVALLRLLK